MRLSPSVLLLSLVAVNACAGDKPGWVGFAARMLPANIGLAAWLAWTAGRLDWLGLQAQPGQRVAWLAGVIVLGVLGYFALLMLCGLRLRQFARKA